MTINITDPDLASMRPSCKLVYLCIKQHGPLQLAELRHRTSLSESTARAAVQTLQTEGLVSEHTPPADPQTTEYELDSS